MTIKTIDQLCARDIGKRIRYVDRSGDVVEGALGYVKQHDARARFAIFGRLPMFEIQVAGFRLGGLGGRTEVEFT